ncbi:hypothetical protein AGMMS49991_04260 [Spirochaetia bacterium]|nr:hypothetical protein AGMMS49991_04260 [Spirochaetia bacterium]
MKNRVTFWGLGVVLSAILLGGISNNTVFAQELVETDSQETEKAEGLQTEAEDVAELQTQISDPEQAEAEVAEISGQEATDQPAETEAVELSAEEVTGQQTEAEAVARQQAEADAGEQAEAEALARQWAEADAREQAEAEALARQQTEDAAGEQAEVEAVVRLEAVGPQSTSEEPGSTQTRPQYLVQSGDSYWTIAANPQVYNNPRLWRRLYEANRSKMVDPNNPNLIEPGMLIDFAMPKYYTVKAGDNLWDIAANPLIYNNPWLWHRLYEANRDKLEDPNNPNLIESGIVIEIPSLNGEYREGNL